MRPNFTSFRDRGKGETDPGGEPSPRTPSTNAGRGQSGSSFFVTGTAATAVGKPSPPVSRTNSGSSTSRLQSAASSILSTTKSVASFSATSASSSSSTTTTGSLPLPTPLTRQSSSMRKKKKKTPAQEAVEAAKALSTKGNYEGAVVKFNEALTSFPELRESSGFFLSRGTANFYRGSYTDALADFDAASALDDTKAALAFNRGNVLRALNRDADALGSYQKAVELDPKCAEAYVMIGKIYLRLNKPKHAVTAANKVLELYNTKYTTPSEDGGANDSRTPEVVEEERRKTPHSDGGPSTPPASSENVSETTYVAAHDIRMQALAKMGQTTEAIVSVRVLMESYRVNSKSGEIPKSQRAKFALIYSHAAEQLGLLSDRYDTAVEYAREAVRLNPSYACYFCLGEQLFNRGSHEEAAEAFASAALCDPSMYDAPLFEGACHIQAGNYDAALPCLRRAETLAKEKGIYDTKLSFYLGLTCVTLERYDEAIPPLQELLSPPNPNESSDVSTVSAGEQREMRKKARTFLASCYLNAGDELRAYQVLEAGRAGETDPEVHFHAGYAASLVDKVNEARACFEQCLRLDPKHAKARECLARLPPPALVVSLAATSPSASASTTLETSSQAEERSSKYPPPPSPPSARPPPGPPPAPPPSAPPPGKTNFVVKKTATSDRLNKMGVLSGAAAAKMTSSPTISDLASPSSSPRSSNNHEEEEEESRGAKKEGERRRQREEETEEEEEIHESSGRDEPPPPLPRSPASLLRRANSSPPDAASPPSSLTLITTPQLSLVTSTASPPSPVVPNTKLAQVANIDKPGGGLLKKKTSSTQARLSKMGVVSGADAVKLTTGGLASPRAALLVEEFDKKARASTGGPPSPSSDAIGAFSSASASSTQSIVKERSAVSSGVTSTSPSSSSSNNTTPSNSKPPEMGFSPTPATMKKTTTTTTSNSETTTTTITTTKRTPTPKASSSPAQSLSQEQAALPPRASTPQATPTPTVPARPKSLLRKRESSPAVMSLGTSGSSSTPISTPIQQPTLVPLLNPTSATPSSSSSPSQKSKRGVASESSTDPFATASSGGSTSSLVGKSPRSAAAPQPHTEPPPPTPPSSSNNRYKSHLTPQVAAMVELLFRQDSLDQTEEVSKILVDQGFEAMGDLYDLSLEELSKFLKPGWARRIHKHLHDEGRGSGGVSGQEVSSASSSTSSSNNNNNNNNNSAGAAAPRVSQSRPSFISDISSFDSGRLKHVDRSSETRPPSASSSSGPFDIAASIRNFNKEISLRHVEPASPARMRKRTRSQENSGMLGDFLGNVLKNAIRERRMFIAENEDSEWDSAPANNDSSFGSDGTVSRRSSRALASMFEADEE